MKETITFKEINEQLEKFNGCTPRWTEAIRSLENCFYEVNPDADYICVWHKALGYGARFNSWEEAANYANTLDEKYIVCIRAYRQKYYERITV